MPNVPLVGNSKVELVCRLLAWVRAAWVKGQGSLFPSTQGLAYLAPLPSFLNLEVTQPSKFGERVTKGGPAEANASRTWDTFQNTCVQETLSKVDIPRRHPEVRRTEPPFQLGSHLPGRTSHTGGT